MTKEQKRFLALNEEEYGVVVNALYDMHNDLIKEERPTDAVDDLILKTIDAPSKKVKNPRRVGNCKCNEAR